MRFRHPQLYSDMEKSKDVTNNLFLETEKLFDGADIQENIPTSVI